MTFGLWRSMSGIAPLFTSVRRYFRFATFERTSSDLPRSRYRRGSVSPYGARPGPAKHCCCAPLRTLIPTKV